MYIPSFGASKFPENSPLLFTPTFIKGKVPTPEASMISILSSGEALVTFPFTSTFLEHEMAKKAIINIKKYFLTIICLLLFWND